MITVTVTPKGKKTVRRTFKTVAEAKKFIDKYNIAK